MFLYLFCFKEIHRFYPCPNFPVLPVAPSPIGWPHGFEQAGCITTRIIQVHPSTTSSHLQLQGIKVSLSMEGGNWMSFRVPSKPKPFCNSRIIIIIYPSFSVLLNSLYLNYQIYFFFPNSVPIPLNWERLRKCLRDIDGLNQDTSK